MRWLSKSITFLALVVLLVLTALYLKAVTLFPNELTLIKGQEYIYFYKMPFVADVSVNGKGVMHLENKKISEQKNSNQTSAFSKLNLLKPVLFESDENCKLNVNLKIMGLLPLGNINIDIVDERKVIACGNTIGVKMELDKILVIGMSYFENTAKKSSLPVKDTGIKPGDFIMEVNGKTPSSINEFIEMVQKSAGKTLTIVYKEKDGLHSAQVNPQKALDDNIYHLGIWVRENTAGIGTLTFYDPQTRLFGALGHGITDIDTGALMPVGSGEILESNILTIKKGYQGYPGELKGVFLEDRSKLGVLEENTTHGIFGVLFPDAVSRLSGTEYPIGVKADAKEGDATILANISGSTVSEYAIQILKIAKQDVSGSKGMVIKITDEKLLSLTGGIVQGMSGCPIIQNGKIIGAVTHVLINDPTRGYGIFIENMLKHLNDVAEAPMKKSA